MAEATAELGHLLSRTNFELFDFEYQFDDPNFKAEIEQAVIDFYYFYEIGQEVPERFKHRFKTRFTRLISYYNNLHNTTLLSYNPLINSKMTEALNQLATTSNTRDNLITTNNTQNNDTTTTDTGTVGVVMHSEGTATLDKDSTKNQDDTGTTTIDADKNTKGSDYPQQPIAGGDYLADEKDEVSNQTTTLNTHRDIVESENSTTTSTDDSDATTTNNLTNKVDGLVTNNGTVDELLKTDGTIDTTYTKTIEGLTGTTYQELISKERENLLRIKDNIIQELKPCFILVH